MGMNSTICGVCGKECGINRYWIKSSKAWLCPACLKRLGGLNAMVNGKSFTQSTIEEIRRAIQHIIANNGVENYDAEKEVLTLSSKGPLLIKYIAIKEFMNYTTETTPIKVHFGSATVDGVTTGGFYTTGGQTVFGGSVHSGQWKMLYTGPVVSAPANHTGEYLIRTIQLRDQLYEQAKRSEIQMYLDDRKQIVVVQGGGAFSTDREMAALETKHMMANLNSLEVQDKVKSGYPSREKCEIIYNWLITQVHSGINLEFHTAGKVDWTLTDEELTIVKQSVLSVPGTYKLSEIKHIEHKPAKGKFLPSKIVVSIVGKEYPLCLCYFDDERAKGEQAFQYLSEHV
ncbi:MAG: hypothetical protein IKH57_11325 [Clostridia bacterium]|nr:hypothetical protein [Clostridia bacterium]